MDKPTPEHDYQPATMPGEITLVESCPCCGAMPRLWQYTRTGPRAILQRVMMCQTDENIGPQTTVTTSGCPLADPGPEFYQPTAREAVRFWNEYARALVELRAKNRLGVTS